MRWNGGPRLLEQRWQTWGGRGGGSAQRWKRVASCQLPHVACQKRQRTKTKNKKEKTERLTRKLKTKRRLIHEWNGNFLVQNLDARHGLVGAARTKPQPHVVWFGPLGPNHRRTWFGSGRWKQTTGARGLVAADEAKPQAHVDRRTWFG